MPSCCPSPCLLAPSPVAPSCSRHCGRYIRLLRRTWCDHGQTQRIYTADEAGADTANNTKGTNIPYIFGTVLEGEVIFTTRTKLSNQSNMKTPWPLQAQWYSIGKRGFHMCMFNSLGKDSIWFKLLRAVHIIMNQFNSVRVNKKIVQFSLTEFFSVQFSSIQVFSLN